MIDAANILGDSFTVAIILITLEKMSEAMIILINMAGRFVKGGLT